MQENLPLALRHQLMRNTLPGAKNARTHADICVHRNGFRLFVFARVAIDRLHNPRQPIDLNLVRELARLVRRRQATHARLRPDLQEMTVFVLVAVVLGVADARAGRGELDFAAAQLLQVAHAVLVLELAVHDVRPDQEFGVAVRAEARAALDAVFVDYAQGAEVFVLGVVVAGEAEGVEGVEPPCQKLDLLWWHEIGNQGDVP